MTDTEAKALALELLNTVRDSRGLPTATMEDAHGFAWFDALCRAIEREAATEARHAAELREQAERFSDAVKRYYGINGCPPHPILAPFILPAPDPLVDVIAAALREASPFADDGHDYTAEAKVAAAAVRAQQKDTNA